MQLSIIVPIYKESPNSIQSLIQDLNSQIQDANTYKIECILVLAEENSAKNNPKSPATEKNHAKPREQVQDILKQNPSLKHLENTLHIISSKKGRASQLNAAAKIAKGEILLFLHADTTLPKNALTLILQHCAKNTHRAGAFSLKFNSSHPLMAIIAWLTTLRSKITRIPYGDQAIFIQNSLFQKLGGFPICTILEDIRLMELLRSKNIPIHIFPEPVLTSARKYEENGILRQVLTHRIIMIKHWLRSLFKFPKSSKLLS